MQMIVNCKKCSRREINGLAKNPRPVKEGKGLLQQLNPDRPRGTLTNFG
jgi:hypothetical protein